MKIMRRDRLSQRSAVADLVQRMEASASPRKTHQAAATMDSPIALALPELQKHPSCVMYRDEDMAARLAWARALRSEASAGALSALQRAKDFGPHRYLSLAGSQEELQEIKQQFPNFEEVLTFIERRALLSAATPGAGFQLPPILLDGPPGIGKTALTERLAVWLSTATTRINVAALDTSFKVMGLDSGYSTGRPGLIWDALQSPCASPVVLLDEIDKRSTSTTDAGLSFMLGLLEPSTARHFQDGCLGLPIDASHIHWLATSNDISAIEAPLLQRFRIFSVEKPVREQRSAVVRSVYRSLRGAQAWAALFPEELGCEVESALVDRSAREIRQALEDACATAVACGRRTISPADVTPARTERRKPVGFL